METNYKNYPLPFEAEAMMHEKNEFITIYMVLTFDITEYNILPEESAFQHIAPLLHHAMD